MAISIPNEKTADELWRQYQDKLAIGDTDYANYLRGLLDDTIESGHKEGESYNVPGIGNGTYSSQSEKEADERKYTSSNSYQDVQTDTNKRLESIRKNQINSVNDSYDDLEKEAYITKMQSEGSLPALLAATGKTGGMAETTAVAPTVAYQNALTSYGKERAKAINDINLATDQQSLQIAIDFADKIINQANIDRSYNYSVNSDQWNRNFQQAQFNYNNSLNEKQYNDSQYQLALNLAQDQADRTGNYQIMSAYGWTPEYIKSAEAEWKRVRGLV